MKSSIKLPFARSIKLPFVGLGGEVDLFAGEHRKTNFLALNPSGRIPTIVDNNDGQRLIVTQSAAILMYLAEKSGLLLPKERLARAKVIE